MRVGEDVRSLNDAVSWRRQISSQGAYSDVDKRKNGEVSLKALIAMKFKLEYQNSFRNILKEACKFV